MNAVASKFGREYASSVPKTPIMLLVSALRVLATDVQSDDGVANATILEAADRLSELAQRTEELRWAADALHTACRDSGLLLGDALKQDERLARIPDLSTALCKLSNVLAYTRKVSL